MVWQRTFGWEGPDHGSNMDYYTSELCKDQERQFCLFFRSSFWLFTSTFGEPCGNDCPFLSPKNSPREKRKAETLALVQAKGDGNTAVSNQHLHIPTRKPPQRRRKKKNNNNKYTALYINSDTNDLFFISVWNSVSENTATLSASIERGFIYSKNVFLPNSGGVKGRTETRPLYDFSNSEESVCILDLGALPIHEWATGKLLHLVC